MNKTYTMDKEVRNSFKRILKDISHNADVKWTEQADDNNVHFTITGSQNVIDLVDKFSSRLNMVNLIVHTKSKFKKDLSEITAKLNGKLVTGTQKGYFIITLERIHQGAFHEMIAERGIQGNISHSLC